MNAFSTWTCPICTGELGWLVISCVYCDAYGYNDYVFNPDINNLINRSEALTPQEELFKELFNHEKLLVKDMDTLTLRAHREELAKIAFEARARLAATDDEEKSRKPKKDDIKGFQRSIAGDDVTSDAINTVKERQQRLTKQEKLLEGLKKLGIDPKEAERIMSSGAILKQINDKKAEPEKVDLKPVFNPFEKKES